MLEFISKNEFLKQKITNIFNFKIYIFLCKTFTFCIELNAVIPSTKNNPDIDCLRLYSGLVFIVNAHLVCISL